MQETAPKGGSAVTGDNHLPDRTPRVRQLPWTPPRDALRTQGEGNKKRTMDPLKATSAKYPVVGAAMSAARARATAAGCNRLEWRTLCAVFDMTASHSKLMDCATVTHVARLVNGLVPGEEIHSSTRVRVGTALRSLSDKGVIGCHVERAGPASRLYVWLPLSDTASVSDSGSGSDPESARDVSQTGGRDVPRFEVTTEVPRETEATQASHADDECSRCQGSRCTPEGDLCPDCRGRAA